jgi:hypothetical protein
MVNRYVLCYIFWFAVVYLEFNCPDRVMPPWSKIVNLGTGPSVLIIVRRPFATLCILFRTYDTKAAGLWLHQRCCIVFHVPTRCAHLRRPRPVYISPSPACPISIRFNSSLNTAAKLAVILPMRLKPARCGGARMIWRPDAHAHLRHVHLVWPLERSRYSANKRN